MAADASIAIVDDDELVRTSLAGLFRSYGVAAEAFSSAGELLASEPDRFDVVVSDLQMPEMNGLELRAVLRARERPLPVIIITAFPDRATRFTRADASLTVLEKPINSAALFDSIEAALGRPIV